MVSWLEAVKEYSKTNGKFVIPKKDSDQYKAIKTLQEKMNNTSAKVESTKDETSKKPKKVAKAKEEAVVQDAPVAPVKRAKKVATEVATVTETPTEVKQKKPRAKKEVAPVVNEVIEAVVEKKTRKPKALRGEPKVTIQDKVVTLTFD